MTRILMIDDDEQLVALVREYLASAGFQVEGAGDGPAGLAAIRRAAPDLVLLDLMLPGLDGLEVCRRLRQTSRVPVLMLTARGDATDRVVGLELGADDYLPKPFEPRELLARIRAVLRRSGETPEAAPATPLVVGSLVVHPAARRVTVDGREVELTTAEFELLHALAAGAGRVLSRDQLLERVHGGAVEGYDRSVDVHMSRLRAKLGDDPRRPRLLKTVRGVGYQLARPEPA